jgi:hypothetical protein
VPEESAGVRRLLVVPLANWLGLNSTQLIQEEDPAEKHAQRNPEMNVGCDRAIQIAGSSVGWVSQYCGLGMKF